jgi:hypothetical protein
MVPEAGAWAGFVSKTPTPRRIVADIAYEKPDRYTLPDDCRACWKCGADELAKQTCRIPKKNATAALREKQRIGGLA